MATAGFLLGFDPADLRAAEGLGQVRVIEQHQVPAEQIVPRFGIDPAELEAVRAKIEQAPIIDTRGWDLADLPPRGEPAPHVARMLQGSVVASPAGALHLCSFQSLFEAEFRVSLTVFGIDGGVVVPAPAGEFIGIEFDPEEVGCGELARDGAERQLLAEFGEGWRHIVGADGAEPRVVALVRPEDCHDSWLSGTILVVCHDFTPVSGRTDRMAEGGAESTQVDGRASGGQAK